MTNNVSIKLIILLLLLLSTLPLGISISISSLSKLKNDANAINTIGFIRGSSQRIVKDISTAEKIEIIRSIKEKFNEINKYYIRENKNYFRASAFEQHYEELKACWEELSKIILDESVTKGDILPISERCWKSADATTNAAEKISNTKFDEIVAIVLSIGSIIFLILIFTLKLIYTEVKNKLEVHVIQDTLTQLYNRAYLLKRLESTIKSFERTRYPFCLLFIDIDHFKTINDTLGHSIGDEILKSFAQILIQSLREEDMAFRYGGEEFVVLAQYANTAQAILLAERIRVNVQAFDFKLKRAVTVSIGVCEYKLSYSIDDIINRADDMMYQAKKEGRNRTCGYTA